LLRPFNGNNTSTNPRSVSEATIDLSTVNRREDIQSVFHIQPPPLTSKTKNAIGNSQNLKQTLLKFTIPKRVPPTSKGPTVVIVGNGQSTIGKKMGKEIDDHDIVVRFNFFQLDGFKQDLGTKTDIWILGELKAPGTKGTYSSSHAKFISPSRMDTRVKPEKYIVPIVWPLNKICSPKKKLACKPTPAIQAQRRRTMTRVRKAYESHHIDDKLIFMHSRIEYLLQAKWGYLGKWPSTGILGVIYCLETYPDSQINLIGFDFHDTHLGHYWEEVRKTTTVHSMSGEGNLIDALVAKGYVTMLSKQVSKKIPVKALAVISKPKQESRAEPKAKPK